MTLYTCNYSAIGHGGARVCQKFKTTLYINQTRNLSESHLSCEFSLFLIFKYSEMPPKAFYKAKTDANMV